MSRVLTSNRFAEGYERSRVSILCTVHAHDSIHVHLQPGKAHACWNHEAEPRLGRCAKVTEARHALSYDIRAARACISIYVDRYKVGDDAGVHEIADQVFFAYVLQCSLTGRELLKLIQLRFGRFQAVFQRRDLPKAHSLQVKRRCDVFSRGWPIIRSGLPH